MDFDAMMKQMREQYLADLNSKTTELENMVEANDQEALESFFHKLKGSGASYGLPQFTEYGARYELKAKNRELSTEDLKSCKIEFNDLLNANSSIN